jgi:hypothetical protein
MQLLSDRCSLMNRFAGKKVDYVGIASMTTKLKMRKPSFVILSLLVFLVYFSTSSLGVTPVSISTYTAFTSFSGAGTVSLNVTLVNINPNVLTPSTSIWWAPTDITLGNTQWMRAQVFAVVESTITAAAGAIQIYTDNTNGSANPRYVGVSTNSAPGLVGYQAGVPYISSITLSMCWRIMDSTTIPPAANLTINQGAPGYPSRLWSSAEGNSYPCFLWMTDKSQWGGAQETDYSIIKEGLRGIQAAESTWASGCASPDAVYFGANFTSALTPATYQTTTLTFEAFTE